MAEGARPSVSTIPPHRAFVDALAAGLLARAGDDPMVLARELVLLPNNRSCRALSDAFVRRLGPRGLLLPRMAPKIGRAPGRDRVCQYVEISVVAVSIKKKN